MFNIIIIFSENYSNQINHVRDNFIARLYTQLNYHAIKSERLKRHAIKYLTYKLSSVYLYISKNIQLKVAYINYGERTWQTGHRYAEQFGNLQCQGMECRSTYVRRDEIIWEIISNEAKLQDSYNQLKQIMRRNWVDPNRQNVTVIVFMEQRLRAVILLFCLLDFISFKFCIFFFKLNLLSFQ